jgi:hypothetical protein
MKRSSSARSRALFGRQRRGRIQDLLGSRSGFGGAAIDLHDGGCGLLGAFGDVLDAFCDLLGRRALLFDRAGNRRGDRRDLRNRGADFLDRRDRFLRRVLHARDVVRDLVGRLRGLAGQRFDLGSDDGKSAAGIARARRLDGGVQRQKIGLFGDRRDQLDDVADLLGGARQFADALVGLLRLDNRRIGNPAGFVHALADLLDRSR